MRRRPPFIALTSLSALLLSCGGGDSPTPPSTVDEGQTVTVTVATAGVDLDPDGYTVRLGTRSATVAASGTATFDDVAAGSYDVTLDGVANNCFVEGATTRTVSVTASSGASASFSVDCGVDFADGVPTVACTGLSPAASSGMPLDEVPAGSVPAGLSATLVARVLDANGADLGYTWLNVEDDGEATLIVPLHPDGAAGGGDVWIRVTDGAAACAPWAFTIESIPPAPGEMAAVVDALQEIIRLQAAAFETTPSDLRTTPPDDLPDVLLPLAAVQWVLDHPDNDASLRAFADGTAPGDLHLDLAEALVAHTRLREALQAPQGSTANAVADPPLPTTPAANCTRAAIAGSTQKLDMCMGSYAAAIQALSDVTVQTVAPRVANALWLTQLTPALQDAAIRRALRGLTWVAVDQNLRTVGAFPSELQSPVVTATPTRFNEDSPTIGSWSGTVTATSRGWQAAFTSLERALTAQTLSLLTEMGNFPTALAQQVQGLLAGPLADRLPPDLSIAQETFGPVPVDDPMWSDANYLPDPGASIVKVDHQRYRPVMEGPTALGVSVPPVGGSGVFGGASTVATVTELNVDPITLRIEPADTIMDPDDTAALRYLFQNTKFPDSVEMKVEQGTAAMTFGGGAAILLTYTPPATASFSDPDSIHIRYTGRTGARANGGPDRSTFAIIRFGKVIITPQPACLDTLEQRAFAAEVKGVDNQDVTWSAAFGTIDSNGNYTAPPTRPTSGVDTIKATSVEEPQLVGELVVPIGCACNFRLTVGNQVVTAQAGDRMVFNTDSVGGLWNVSATRASQGWNVRMLPVDGDPASRPNAPGTWPMVIQGDMGLSSPDVIYATDPPPAATLVLDALVPRQRVQGTVNGPVYIVSTTDPRPSNADFFFAIRYAPGQFTCTVGGGP